jgi:hypothetical protein
MSKRGAIPNRHCGWTCKSTRAIADDLTGASILSAIPKWLQIPNHLGYSLQGNRKTEEGEDHPDRDAQFRHIYIAVKQYLKHRWPVISVDTKKKELVGNYHNGAQHRGFRRNSHGKCVGIIFPSRGSSRLSPRHLRHRVQYRVRQCRDRS